MRRWPRWPSTWWLLDLEGVFLTPVLLLQINTTKAQSAVGFAIKSSASSLICRAFDGVWPGWVSRTWAGALLKLLMQVIDASLAAGPRRYGVIIGYFKSAGAEWKGNEPSCSVGDIVPISALPGVS